MIEVFQERGESGSRYIRVGVFLDRDVSGSACFMKAVYRDFGMSGYHLLVGVSHCICKLLLEYGPISFRAEDIAHFVFTW